MLETPWGIRGHGARRKSVFYQDDMSLRRSGVFTPKDFAIRLQSKVTPRDPKPRAASLYASPLRNADANRIILNPKEEGTYAGRKSIQYTQSKQESHHHEMR